jgi:hypothetical protein
MFDLLLGTAAAVALAKEGVTGRAADGPPNSISLNCTALMGCDVAVWSLNKDGYALIAQLNEPATYQVCTRSIIVKPPVAVVLSLRVDGQVISSNLGPERTYGCAVVTGKRVEIFNRNGPVPSEPAPALLGYVGGQYRRLGPSNALNFASPFHAPVLPKFEQVVVYRGPELKRARICLSGPQKDPELPSVDFRRQSVVWVGGKGLPGTSPSENATFSAASCVDVEGDSITVSRVPAATAPEETIGYLYFGAPAGSGWESPAP